MISLILLSLYLLVLAFVPATRHLGYPLAVALTLPITLLALGRGLRGSSPWLLLGPVALYAVVLEPFHGCDLLNGSAWLLIGPGIGLCFGGALGLFLGVRLGWKRGALLSLALVLASLSAASWRLYQEPQLFAFEAFFGSWHGPIYDEWVTIGWGLVTFRLAVLFLAVSIYWQLRRPSPLSGLACIVMLILSLPAWYLGDRSSLQSELDQRLEEAGLVVNFASGSAQLRQAKAIMAQARFERQDLSRRMLGPTAEEPKVTIWLYPNAGTKRRLIGAHGVLIARPWQGEIHLHYSRSPDPHLRHEMVHVIGATLAAGPFGVPMAPLPNAGLIEGLAVALGPHDDSLSLQGAAAGMLRRKQLPSMGKLFSLRFSLGHGRRSYRAAGAFLQFVAKEEGWEKVLEAYRAGGLDQIGLDSIALEKAWHKTLSVLPPEPGERRALIRGYSGRAMLDRPCPNEVQAAWRHAQAAGDLQLDERERRYRAVMAVAGNCKALASLADLYHRLGEKASLDRIENEIFARGLSTRDLGRIFMRRADDAARAEDDDRVRDHLARALATAPPPHRFRALLLRWLLLPDRESFLRVADYLALRSRKKQKPLVAAMVSTYGDVPSSSRPALAYLLGRWFDIVGKPDQAERWLRRAHPLPPTLSRERLRFSAKVAERRQRACLSRRRLERLAEDLPAARDLLPQQLGWLIHRQPAGASCDVAPASPLR